jgi:proline iminopeptidase
MPRTRKGDLHTGLKIQSTLTASSFSSRYSQRRPPERMKSSPTTAPRPPRSLPTRAGILTPSGAERLRRSASAALISGVLVRGNDRRNSVLLYIHGGPGHVSIPMSWWFTQYLGEYFTAIQWDQRATGKTYLLSDSAEVAPPSRATT